MSEAQCPKCGHIFDPAIDPEWAARMRRERVARGITLGALATQLGFSTAYLSDIERVRRNKPSAEVVQRWERFILGGAA